MTPPIFHCEIDFFPSAHLNTIYDGFWKLKQKGLISLKINRIKSLNDKPILKVIVNKTYIFIYDALDGFNWVDGSFEENIIHFETKINCDFYFKRSYSPVLKKHLKKGSIFPLGINFNYDYDGDYPLKLDEKLRSFVKRNITKNSFKLKFYEYPPIMNPENKILFLCGLWDPSLVKCSQLKAQREKINTDRIALIRTCKSEFGKYFTGGIQIDNYSQKIAQDVLVSKQFTNKQKFLRLIKNHNICIATTGLHNSIGWKFAEYAAASRAIISEPLNYNLPGNFQEGTNYLSFTSNTDLILKIQKLLGNNNTIQKIMTANYNYYKNHMHSEKMVWNSLLKILKNE